MELYLIYLMYCITSFVENEDFRFAVEPSMNQSAVLYFHNFAMILTAHIHISAARHHKGATAKSDHKEYYSRICLIGHLKGIKKKWRIRQTGENSIIEARIFYQRNSYT